MIIVIKIIVVDGCDESDRNVGKKESSNWQYGINDSNKGSSRENVERKDGVTLPHYPPHTLTPYQIPTYTPKYYFFVIQQIIVLLLFTLLLQHFKDTS